MVQSRRVAVARSHAPQPHRLAAGRGRGEYRIEVAGVEIEFCDEDPGIQVCFYGELPEPLARRIIDEVLSNIESAAGQRGRIVEL